MMDSGRLQELITIQRPTITKDEFGANKTVWNDIINTRSDVQYDSGNRVTENNEIVFNYSKVFTVRYYHKVDEKDRIVWNGKRYRILSIEPNKSHQKLTIRTELINE